MFLNGPDTNVMPSRNGDALRSIQFLSEVFAEMIALNFLKTHTDDSEL